jgi:hypothetical protein
LRWTTVRVVNAVAPGNSENGRHPLRKANEESMATASLSEGVSSRAIIVNADDDGSCRPL